MKLSKNRLRKITADGPYAGKNVTVFTADGKKMFKSDFDREQYLSSMRGNIAIQDDQDVES